MARLILAVSFFLLLVDPAFSWLMLGRFLIQPVARISAPALYRAWVSSGRPAWNFVRSPAFMNRAGIGLGVVAIGSILNEFGRLENQARRHGFVEGQIYSFPCSVVEVSMGCYVYEDCGSIGVWGSPLCYGVPRGGVGDCPPDTTYLVHYGFKYVAYRYAGGMFVFEGEAPFGTSGQCPYGCSFSGVDQYGVCPDPLPSSFAADRIPFSSPPIPIDGGEGETIGVDPSAVEALIRRELGEQVQKRDEVFIFPNIPALVDKLSEAFPHLSRQEIEQGLEGVRDASQAPDFPAVDSSVVVVDVIRVIDRDTGVIDNPIISPIPDDGGERGVEGDDVIVSPPPFDDSLPNLEKLPFPLQLVQSLAQNHPIIRLIRGVGVSCGGSCSVPISVSSSLLSFNTSLDFCPYENVFSFVGSVLLAFVPFIWLFARRE